MTKIDDLDPGISELVAALQSFPGIYTISSCAGHQNPIGCQSPAGSWFVSFRMMRDEKGYLVESAILTVEFITYWVINELRDPLVSLTLDCEYPYFDEEGSILTFDIAGVEGSPDPNNVARGLVEGWRRYLSSSGISV